MPPTLDVLIAAYNEAGCILEKLRNCQALDYPCNRLTITVVTDGSTDATPDLVRSMTGGNIRLLHQPERRGKGAALARALPHLQGEIVLFTDANCLLAPDTARLMVRHLTDAQVGGVSGAKRIRSTGQPPDGEGLYWRYESWLKGLDSRFGSVMGAPGEIWAARRAAYQAPPPDIVLDDFYASMDLVARGWRVEYEPEALSLEEPSPIAGRRLGTADAQRRRGYSGGVPLEAGLACRGAHGIPIRLPPGVALDRRRPRCSRCCRSGRCCFCPSLCMLPACSWRGCSRLPLWPAGRWRRTASPPVGLRSLCRWRC